MTDYPKNFGDATQAMTAFKITAQELIKLGDSAASADESLGNTACNVLRDISQTIPFPAIAGDFKNMLEVVPSPLAERIAELAVDRAQAYANAGQQFVFQLHLADVSEAVPGISDQLPPADELRKDVIANLDFQRPAQLVKLHEETDQFVKGLSPKGKSILAESIYAAAFELSHAEFPSPLIADRLHSLMLNNIGGDDVSARYSDATSALFKVASVQTQRAILSEKINSIVGTDEDDVVQSDAVLKQFGTTVADFTEADGSAKSADSFIARAKSEGQAAAPAPQQS